MPLRSESRAFGLQDSGARARTGKRNRCRGTGVPVVTAWCSTWSACLIDCAESPDAQNNKDPAKKTGNQRRRGFHTATPSAVNIYRLWTAWILPMFIDGDRRGDSEVLCGSTTTACTVLSLRIRLNPDAASAKLALCLFYNLLSKSSWMLNRCRVMRYLQIYC